MKKLAILAICVGLTACGGGGSSSSNETVTEPVQDPTVYDPTITEQTITSDALNEAGEIVEGTTVTIEATNGDVKITEDLVVKGHVKIKG